MLLVWGFLFFLSVRVDEAFWSPRGVELVGGEWEWDVRWVCRIRVLFRVCVMVVNVFWVLPV